jgi:rhodanese-related sulfurtransferase
MSASADSPGISPSDLLTALRDPSGEIAVLDVREEGRFASGHILLATSLPLSRLERDIGRLVPRRGCRIVLCDDDDGLAPIAAAKLRALGYSDVLCLQNGLPAWTRSGGTTFEGLNVPSKALGILAQQQLGIPEIDPERLAETQQVQVIDCRPFAEYQRGTIPGAVSCPGVELVPNVTALEDSKPSLLVLTCAGRTRGLVAAQTLIDFGYAGRITALRDGTMGWELAGNSVEKDAGRRLVLARADRTRVDAAAEKIRRQLDIAVLDADALAQWRAESGRTTYVFDIRQKAEYEQGHLAGAWHIEGGQLVQNLDMHVPVRGARIVLSDDDGVRATAAALWLRRMGWRDLAIAPLARAGSLERGAEASAPIRCPESVAYVEPADLQHLLEADKVLLIDLATSREYRAGHIPGAWFVVRSRLPRLLPRLPKADMIVLASPDGVLAAFASTDEVFFGAPVRVLKGGTAAWQRAGYPLSRDFDRFVDEADDVVLKPSELVEGREAAMREYLSGSEGLLAKVERDGTLRLAAVRVPR